MLISIESIHIDEHYLYVNKFKSYLISDVCSIEDEKFVLPSVIKFPFVCAFQDVLNNGRLTCVESTLLGKQKRLITISKCYKQKTRVYIFM